MNIGFELIPGRTVSRIGLGTMRMADRPDQRRGGTAPVWRSPADRPDLIRFVREAVDLGVDHVDTADAYALGAGEELIGEALVDMPDVAIATKIGNVRPSASEWVALGHPAYLRQQLELSHRRLRRERLDLVYLHRIDDAYPLEDQLGVLAEARAAGTVGGIGISLVDVDTFERARRVTAIDAVQNPFSVGERSSSDLVQATADAETAFVAFFPLAMGDAGQDERVTAVSSKRGADPSQVALAWLLAQGSHVLPIPGTTTLAHLRSNLGALELDLSDEELAVLANG
ncbi:aldo/keto reductase [Microbacterium sp. 18062]|uniref:aldo/keto reductase n=1 Tax=Microbacterium sp. 18062 TaxID=2681410 RepID=UPI0013590DB8|nr:aldo/keto reductase [Microbacterium sp. 18062]